MAADLPIRASDDDRERAVTLLREQLVAGRLTSEDFDERVGQAYTAGTWDDLRNLFRDLPVSLPLADGRAGPLDHPVRAPLRITRVWPVVLVVGLTAIAITERAPLLAPLIVFGWIIAVIAYCIGRAREK